MPAKTKIGPNYTHAVNSFSGATYLHVDGQDEPSFVIKDGVLMQIEPEARRVIHKGIIRQTLRFLEAEKKLGKIVNVPAIY